MSVNRLVMDALRLVFVLCILLQSACSCQSEHDTVDKDVHFMLWTRETETFENLDKESNISTSHFRGNRPTKIYVHGYADSGLTRYALEAKDGYLNQSDCNFISVDWSALVKAPWYFLAVRNTYRVGKRLAEFIEFLDREVGACLESFHLVGFSIGAHVVGIAGKLISEAHNGTEKVGRITGLDPALPGFEWKNATEKLTKFDARFVDIIHTNGGRFYQGCLGNFEKTGHVDFYPNGGKHQPGCGIPFVDMLHSCSHLHAPKYFVHSITSNDYKSCKCDNWRDYKHGRCNCGEEYVLMGEKCPTSASGTYYLSVGESQTKHDS